MFNRIRQFFIDVQAEFKRIQWATRERTIRQTSIVVLVSLIIAIYLGVADLGLSNLMQLLISAKRYAMSDSELNSETPINPTETAEPAEPAPVENSHFKWYILQAHTGYEKRVKLTIEKQLEIKGLQHLVGEIFIPSEEVTRSKGGKQRVVTQKYFPGYLLLHMDLQEDLWHLIIKTNRVTGFVGRKHHEENRYIPPIPPATKS